MHTCVLPHIYHVCMPASLPTHLSVKKNKCKCLVPLEIRRGGLLKLELWMAISCLLDVIWGVGREPTKDRDLTDRREEKQAITF